MRSIRVTMKSEPGPPITLGNAAKVELRPIVWCRGWGHQVEPDPAYVRVSPKVVVLSIAHGVSEHQNRVMPRVVPSQIVEFVEAEFPFAHPGLPSSALHVRMDSLATLLRLIDLLPDELMVIDGKDYNQFLRSIETMRDAVQRASRSRDQATTVPVEHALLSALTNARSILGRLPDQRIPATTAGLPFITDAPLRESIRADIAFANQAFSGGEWKAATVLAGAVVEALLLWAITKKKATGERENARKTVIPGASPNPNTWDLDGYIKVALELALIEDETAKQAALAKDFRNLIHPGRSARLSKVCDKGTAHSALAALELVLRDIRNAPTFRRTATRLGRLSPL